MITALYIFLAIIALGLILFAVIPYFVYFYSSVQMEAWYSTFVKLMINKKKNEENKKEV